MLLQDGFAYEETFRSARERVPLVKCFRDRKNAILKERGPNDPFLVLEMGPVPPGGNVDMPELGISVTLDVRRGFMPVVIERSVYVDKKPRLERRTTVTSWKTLGGGVQVPLTATTQHFDTVGDLGPLGETLTEEVLTVDEAKSKWNTHIPAETFQLALPAGTRITDHFRKVMYVTGKPDPGKNLQSLAANARDSFPVQFGPPPAPKSTWHWWLGGMTLVVVLGTAVVWYLRRKQTRAQP